RDRLRGVVRPVGVDVGGDLRLGARCRTIRVRGRHTEACQEQEECCETLHNHQPICFVFFSLSNDLPQRRRSRPTVCTAPSRSSTFFRYALIIAETLFGCFSGSGPMKSGSRLSPVIPISRPATERIRMLLFKNQGIVVLVSGVGMSGISLKYRCTQG